MTHEHIQMGTIELPNGILQWLCAGCSNCQGKVVLWSPHISGCMSHVVQPLSWILWKHVLGCPRLISLQKVTFRTCCAPNHNLQNMLCFLPHYLIHYSNRCCWVAPCGNSTWPITLQGGCLSIGCSNCWGKVVLWSPHSSLGWVVQVMWYSCDLEFCDMFRAVLSLFHCEKWPFWDSCAPTHDLRNFPHMTTSTIQIGQVELPPGMGYVIMWYGHHLGFCENTFRASCKFFCRFLTFQVSNFLGFWWSGFLTF